MESGCALFAALCKEDLIYSQPMNQLTLNLSFLNLNPKKLFCLDLGLGRPLALLVGQLPDEVTGLSTMDPICVGSVWDLIRRSPARKRIKRHVLPTCHRPPRPETLRWFAWRPSNQWDRRPAQTSETESWIGFRRTWLDYIKVARNPCSCGTG